jgi:rhamnosyltransferase subunit B
MRVLLTSWGSHGDLHPFLSLGTELLRRGHAVTLAGNPIWREETEKAGLRFVEAGPRQTQDMLFSYPEIISRKNWNIDSARALMEKGVVPTFPDMTRALLEEAPRHDVLVAHHFIFPAHVVAEKTGIRWATVTLAPGVIPSAYGMPAGSLAQPLSGPLGRAVHRLIWGMGRMILAGIIDSAVNELRRSQGLAPRRGHFFDSVSPDLNLLLYSPAFAERAPDFSVEKAICGFCFWDPLKAYTPPEELTRFLDSGEKPWLFTLGSTAIANPRGFYEAAAEAVRGTKRRAILLTGRMENRPAVPAENVLELSYAPYGWIMPRCRGVAHQCGIGTTSQALRAGLPALCCPYAFDQPNNAVRVAGLGAGVLVKEHARTGPGLRRAMEQAESAEIVETAARLGKRIREEDGPARAADRLEAFAGA